jgi:hypothetical protein
MASAKKQAIKRHLHERKPVMGAHGKRHVYGGAVLKRPQVERQFGKLLAKIASGYGSRGNQQIKGVKARRGGFPLNSR